MGRTAGSTAVDGVGERRRRARRDRSRTSRRPWSIARRLATAHLAALLILTAALVAFSYQQTQRTVYGLERANVLSTARLIADEERIRDGFRAADPSAALQSLTTELADQAQVDWVTFFGTDYTRVAHRDPAQNGTRYPEDLSAVLAGQGQVDTVATGPAGLSLRALVPVLSSDAPGAEVVGIVGVGHRVSELDIAVTAQIPRILLGMGLVAALGLAGSIALGRYIRRTTHGLGPEELAHRFTVLDTALHNVNEGMVLVSGTGELSLYNDRAAELLHLPPFGHRADHTPGTVSLADLHLPAPLAGLLESGRDARDELFAVPGRILVVNQHRTRPAGPAARLRTPAAWRRGRRQQIPAGADGGTVVTLYDRTEVQEMNRELENIRSLTDALRAQTHEHGNRLHTVLSLVELGRIDQARDLLASGVAAGTAQPGPLDPTGEPAVQALLAAKAAQARERGVRMDYRIEVDSATGFSAQDLVTILGNLVDNAIDAAADPARPAEDRWVEAEAHADAGWLVLQVADGGPGPSAEDRGHVFDLGFSTKPAGPAGRGIGLALVRQTALSLGGDVELALDSGTVFTVELPLPADAVRPPRRPAENPPPMTAGGGHHDR
ncbi:ATP-binding protein [Citricoccus sp. K5]|mgnify:CR=1 FL=1|uniref:sensor histidine kinase n=1 Tax=Citricoccus sp. K5 TaxID=2653135 RepID=UPI0012F07FFB|nr:ATP-binding protein [Citricoccus sp. K5]VXB48216.1 Sensor histidine kinase regulating citrate/malate metabolism [Citricoccus sp. K5]